MSRDLMPWEKRFLENYAPTRHDQQVSFVFETTKKDFQVCMWWGWRKNGQLWLAIPPKYTINPSVLMDILKVKPSKPVSPVLATSVFRKSNHADYKDEDKPLEGPEGSENAIAYKTHPPRVWAPYWTDRQPEGGRVYIEQSDWNMYSHTFHYLRKGDPVKIHLGHDNGHVVCTYPFDSHNKYDKDSPTSDESAITPFKMRFLELAIHTANYYGEKITAVTVEYGSNAMIPEAMGKAGYPIKVDRSNYWYGVKETPHHMSPDEELVISAGYVTGSYVIFRRTEFANHNVTAAQVDALLTL